MIKPEVFLQEREEIFRTGLAPKPEIILMVILQTLVDIKAILAGTGTPKGKKQ